MASSSSPSGSMRMQRASLQASNRADGEDAPFVVREFGRIDGEVRSLRNIIRELQKKMDSVDPKTHAAVRQEMTRMREEFSAHMATFQMAADLQQSMSALQRQVDGLASRLDTALRLADARRPPEVDLAPVQSEQARLRKDLDAGNAERAQLLRKMEESRQQLQAEMARMAREFDPSKNEQKIRQAVQREVRSLADDLGKGKAADLLTLQAVVSQTSQEFRSFRREVYEAGVLAPKWDKPADEEQVSVGTLELCEDIFAARLLVKLGYLKGREKKALAMDASDSEDSEERTLALPSFDEWVSGLKVPEVEAAGPGYYAVTTGWLLVCFGTMALQVLIVAVVIKHNWDQAQQACVSPDRDQVSWWVLHLSKLGAVLVAGFLTGKELMDTVNFSMVSALLEARKSMEVILSAGIRVSTILLVGVANFLAFWGLQDPVLIFMNMTALTFIADIGRFILSIAKTGVMGHHISKTMTELNFQLNLNREYPEWFGTVRTVTLLLVSVATVSFAVFLFLLDEPVCVASS